MVLDFCLIVGRVRLDTIGWVAFVCVGKGKIKIQQKEKGVEI